MKILGHKDCNICGMSFYGTSARRNFERHMKRKHFPKIRKAICEFCNKDYKIKSKLIIHLKTCKKKNKLEFPQPEKKKSKRERQISPIAESVSKQEQIEDHQETYKSKLKEEKKELPVWIMKNKKTDRSQIIVDISGKVHFA